MPVHDWTRVDRSLFHSFYLSWSTSISAALNNVIVTAAADSADAFFFIDGATVLALVLIGVASLIAAHAAIATPPRRITTSR